MANRFIGGVLGSRPQANIPFASRASTGTYFNSAGTMVTAPVNQPRLNYTYDGTSWRTPSLLIEPESTNLLRNSEDISATTQTGAAGFTVNQAVAPDGTTTADYIWASATSDRHFVTTTRYTYSTAPGPGTTLTGSIFAKAAGNNFLGIMLSDSASSGGCRYPVTVNLTNGAITNYGYGVSNIKDYSATATPVGNGWYRIVLQMTTTSASTGGGAYMPLFPQPADGSAYSNGGDFAPSYTGSGNGSGVYVWGWQMETRYGATSYIPTAGTTVTRAADVVGPYSTGIYSLEDEQNSTSIDDQFTVTSFTSTGSTSWTAPADVTSVEVLVVAGGGGGSEQVAGGGGGAGGLIYNSSYPVTPGTTYPVVVGAGGATTSNGQNSSFANIISIGGGAGGDYGNPTGTAGRSGGSGGGGGFCQTTAPSLGGPGISTQGNAGGTGSTIGTGGGGGAGSVGGNATDTGGGRGGAGLAFNISGTSTYYGGGGGGGAEASGTSGVASGGVGGGGNGAYRPSATVATSGTANTGGGGGGCYNLAHPSAGAGGSGIVIVRYKRTPTQISATSNAAIVVQKFSTTNLWTVPAGVTQVEALVVAGGGSGANIFGGGGAGGVVYNSALTVIPGQTYTIGVGTGTQGGAAATNTPINGFTGFGSGIGTGSELITNGSGFTNTSGWSATTATLSVPQTGTLRITPNISVNGTASQSITTVIGTTYLLLIKVTSDVGRLLRIRVGTTQVSDNVNDGFWTERTRDSLDNGATGAGFYSQTFIATSTTTWINLQVGNGTGQITDISFISVRPTTISAFGGGGGGAQSNGLSGGSGGGGGNWSAVAYTGGSGTSGQGNNGGTGATSADGHGGGGGGAGSAGANGIVNFGGNGGAGIPFNITGNLEYYAGGGGGGVYTGIYTGAVGGQGGIGGGGAGGRTNGQNGQNGAANTGGGGGGGTRTSSSVAGGAGGSGVVILRYRVPQVATFLDSGSWTCPAGVTSVQALIVAGGGGGGPPGGGGGGAGGLVYSSSVSVTPGVTYPIVVGQGGDGGVYNTRAGYSGGNSSFVNLIVLGGGAGGGNGFGPIGGGSGGGSSGNFTASGVGNGAYGQGNAGGAGTNTGNQANGGGGGAGRVGVSGGGGVAGAGGEGLAYSISGTSVTYAGGGGGSGGSSDLVTGAFGGTGGGGRGGTGTSSNPTPGLINTGGGGGGRGNGGDPGAHGGSGIVIIRWSGA